MIKCNLKQQINQTYTLFGGKKTDKKAPLE